MLDFHGILKALSRRRPVFHSEADFQHELAWEIRSLEPSSRIRLERPISGGYAGATDLIVMLNDVEIGVELKFCTKKSVFQHSNEIFDLKQHGAHPLRRYDICKDIQRMEAFRQRPSARAVVIVLSNDPSYWVGDGINTVCGAFRISEGSVLTGQLNWGLTASDGTKRNRENAISLTGEYQICWKDFSQLQGRAGHFKYLLVEIA